MFLSHSVDLPFDQIACHGFARPPFGNHGAQRGSPRFKQGCLVWAVRRSLGRGVRWLTAQVQGKVLCLCDHRTAKHRLKLCARLQPVQNLACLKPQSDGQALAALCTASIDHCSAAAGAHAGQKAVGACALDFGRLIGAFHDGSLSANSQIPRRFQWAPFLRLLSEASCGPFGQFGPSVSIALSIAESIAGGLRCCPYRANGKPTIMADSPFSDKKSPCPSVFAPWWLALLSAFQPEIGCAVKIVDKWACGLQ